MEVFYFSSKTGNFLPKSLYPSITSEGFLGDEELSVPYSKGEFSDFIKKKTSGHDLRMKSRKVHAVEIEPISFQEEKQQALVSLRKLVNSASLNLSTLTYSQAELSTFPSQLIEAKRHLESSGNKTPLLAGIAQARQLDLTVLAKKIISKSNSADESQTKLGLLIGKGRDYEKRINSTRSRKSLLKLTKELRNDLTT